MNFMDFDRRRDKLRNLAIVLVVALIALPLVGLFAPVPEPVGLALFWTVVPTLIALLVLMCLWHYVGVKEDEASVQGAKVWPPPRNRAGSVLLSGVLLVVIGLVLITYRWHELSISDLWSWLWVAFASFFVIRGVMCFLAADSYDSTVGRLEELEAEVCRLRSELDSRGSERRK